MENNKNYDKKLFKNSNINTNIMHKNIISGYNNIFKIFNLKQNKKLNYNKNLGDCSSSDSS